MNENINNICFDGSAFPCEVSEGKVFYVVKLHEDQSAVIVCEDKEDEPLRGKTD